MLRPGKRIGFSLLACLLGVAGCADPQYPLAQTARAVAVGTDHYWVVGRYGFAAEGRGGRLTRSDFQETHQTPDWAWEATMGSAGYVVELPRGGRTSFAATRQTYLLTYGGELFRRDGGTWTPLEARFTSSEGPPDEDAAQIDEVLVTPEGRALVHVHATQLLETDGGGLESGVMKRESLPHYFTWIGFVHGKLHGLGWEGDDRAVLVRDAPNRWSKVVVVPRGLGDPIAVVPLGETRIGVVVGGAVHGVEGGLLREVSVAELGPRRSSAPLVVAGDAPSASPLRVPAPSEGEPGTPPARAPAVPADPRPGDATPSRPISPPQPPEPPHRPDAHLAADDAELRGKVQSVLRVGPDRYALVIGEGYSGGDTVLLLGGGATRVARCDILRVRHVIGVVEAADGTVYVPTDRASVVVVGADGACGEPQAPLLPDE